MGDSPSKTDRIFHSGPDGKTRVEEVESTPTADGRGILQDMTFSTHVVSLNAMALMHLGEVDGVPELERDITAARHVVDTLKMLEEKTKGNLTQDEAGLLSTILYDLQVKCVTPKSE